MKFKLHNLHLFIPKSLNAEIEKVAKKLGISKTKTIIIALRDWVRQNGERK